MRDERIRNLERSRTPEDRVAWLREAARTGDWFMLECEPGSLAGPPDEGALARFEKSWEYRFPADFRSALPVIHGGIPQRQFFTTPSGRELRVGRFLPVVDRETKLPPPFVASWEFGDGLDERRARSIRTVLDMEGPSCRTLFDGSRLIPFAALYIGLGPDGHPDQNSLTSCDCDLLCFDRGIDPQPVVLWKPQEAFLEYDRWESLIDAEEDEDAWEEILPNYAAFTEPVAMSFTEFALMLRVDHQPH